MTDLENQMLEMGAAAKSASHLLAKTTGAVKNAALLAMAAHIKSSIDVILTENAKDMQLGKTNGLAHSALDRLLLNEQRVLDMAHGLSLIASLPDPVGAVIDEWVRPNGLKMQRVRQPLGVIGVIYESRPNVTADAAALTLKAGNAVILRGGSDSLHSSKAIHQCLVLGLREVGLPDSCVQLVSSSDRACVGMMLQGLKQTIDVIIPRGGKSLVARVQEEARVPVFAHLDGNCHVYVHKDASLDMALKIVKNAKL